MSRAPVKLSREMKLLLLLLLMVALIGLWYLWNKGRSAQEVTDTSPPVTNGSTATGTPPTTPDAPQEGSTNGDESGPVAVNPEGKVEVEVIPPFPGGEQQADTALSSAPATPDGINPQGELASVPTANPFQPLSIERQGQDLTASAPPAAPTGMPETGSVSTGSSTVSVPTTTITPPADVLGQSSGALPIPQIPGSGAATASTLRIPGGDGASSIGASSIGASSIGASVSGGRTATRPASTAQTAAAAQTTGQTTSQSTGRTPGRTTTGATGNGGASSAPTNTAGRPPAVTAIKPGPTVTVRPVPTSGSPLPGNLGRAPAAGSQIGQNRAPQTTPVQTTPMPVPPPVAGVSAPRTANVTPTSLGTSASGTGATGTGVTASTTGGADSTSDLALPQPSTPQVITELGSEGASSSSARLDTILAEQSLEFNAAVLGPVNTAIFKGKSGFVVVAVGQTIPDTDVTLKEVSATSATLALNNETKTLELDKR